MTRKMQTIRKARQGSRRLGYALALCAVLWLGAGWLPAAHAGELSDAPSRVVVATTSLPANFADTLKTKGLVVMTQERLETLGMVMFELRVDGDSTQQNVFEQLEQAFPGHPFEWMKSDELDYELS